MLGCGSHVLVTNSSTSCPTSGERHGGIQRERHTEKGSESPGFYLPLAVLASSTLTLSLWLLLLFISLLTIHPGPVPVLGTKY